MEAFFTSKVRPPAQPDHKAVWMILFREWCHCYFHPFSGLAMGEIVLCWTLIESIHNLVGIITPDLQSILPPIWYYNSLQKSISPSFCQASCIMVRGELAKTNEHREPEFIVMLHVLLGEFAIRSNAV